MAEAKLLLALATVMFMFWETEIGPLSYEQTI
jgi:hypothetical protein